MDARDCGQLGIEHADEGEQGVALVLQCDTHRADASCILWLTGRLFRDDEVEQFLPRCQCRSGQNQNQNVVAQPLNKQTFDLPELLG